VHGTQKKGIALSRSSRKQIVPPVVTTPEPSVERGPRFRIEADALVSKTYTGKVDLGSYSLTEKNKGRIDKRIEQLTVEGYRNIRVREVSGDD
jgi:hypothetical protein